MLNLGTPGLFVLRSGGVAYSCPFGNVGMSTIAPPGSTGPVIISAIVNTDANDAFAVVGFSATLSVLASASEGDIRKEMEYASGQASS